MQLAPLAGYVAQTERKAWHPVMWQQPPPPVRDEQQPGQVKNTLNLNPYPTNVNNEITVFSYIQTDNPTYEQSTTYPLIQEAPHKRLIRNLHRFFRETENNPESRQRHIEDMLLALPTISKES